MNFSAGSALTCALAVGVLPLASCHFGVQTPAPPRASNGIYVVEPKVYDDASLEVLVRNAQARVAALNSFDQASITKALGSVQGATADQTQIAAQVTGLPKPGATAQAVTPNSPGAPTLPTFSLPGSFSPSAADLFNEQTQLNSQMTNLQLLLEGSLSDQFLEGTNKLKRRVTLGFPISIAVGPQRKYQEAVAEVEITVCNPPGSDQSASNSNPSLVNIIPQENTYNVASLVSKSASISGGAIAGLVNFGGGLVHGHQTFYLVKDQDTLALARPPRSDVCGGKTVTFVWQFRPVLGQKVVRDGMRQTFAQIAMPPGVTFGTCPTTVHIQSVWRRYDARTGRVGAEIPDTKQTPTTTVGSFDLAPVPFGVEARDNGDGTITVKAIGGFKNGMRVRMGSQTFDATTPAQFEQSDEYVKFIAPALALAQLGAKLVNRDGSEADILNGKGGAINPCPSVPPKATPPMAGTPAGNPVSKAAVPVPTAVTAVPLTDTTSILKLPLNAEDHPGPIEVSLVLIGSQVFGLLNSPFLSRSDNEADVVVSNDVLRANAEARWIKLFSSTPPHRYALKASSEFAVSSIVLLATGVKDPTGASDTGNLYLISGSKIGELKIALPPEVKDGTLKTDTMRTFWLSDAQAKSYKSVVLKTDTSAPITAALPASPSAADKTPATTPPQASIDAQPAGGIAASSKSLKLTGTGMSRVAAVMNGITPLAFVAPDDKSLTLTLPALSAPGLTVVFVYADKSLQPYFIPVASGSGK